MIYQFQSQGYRQQSHSMFFPEFDLISLTRQALQNAVAQGSGKAIEDLRRWVTDREFYRE